MASSSVSQEDVDVDFQISLRRSRIRTARARNINPNSLPRTGDANENCDQSDEESSLHHPGHIDHDASPKPTCRLKEKRINRPNHMNKGKQQRDRRRREKRRSTGVVQLHSTESTGGSTGEDDDALLSMAAETKRNTQLNENIAKHDNEMDKPTAAYSSVSTASSVNADFRNKKPFIPRRSKSPSDLDADDEDNQDYDSLTTMSDSTISLAQLQSPPLTFTANFLPATSTGGVPLTATRPTNGRPPTPISGSVDEQLERATAENRRLLSLLEEKERRIVNLETHAASLANEVATLRCDKGSYVQAMHALSTK